MNHIRTAEDLVVTFRERDQKHVILPPGMRFPVALEHYLTWIEPSGVRVYLVFQLPDWKQAVGVVFRRDQQGSSTSPPGLCEWCLSTGPSDQVGLLTATVDSKRRVGLNLCLDLSCLLKLEMVSTLSGIQLPKLTTRLYQQMDRFCREVLGIDGRHAH